jgi:hypothetical protein
LQAVGEDAVRFIIGGVQNCLTSKRS